VGGAKEIKKSKFYYTLAC